MSLPHPTTFSVNDFLDKMEAINDDLDPVNVTILRLIGKLGPRNLLDVARESRLPPSTVYNRVNILESRHSPLSYANPAVSRLGLCRIVLFPQSKAGMESIASQALMIPNYWRTVANAEGAFTHYSVQAVPYLHVPKFRKYLSRLVKEGILTRYWAFQTADVSQNFPDFDYFNPKARFWTFNWKQWARKVERTTAKTPIEEPKGYAVQADKTDLIIVRELELDGRKKFARIAKVVGVTLQAIKFRYDRRIIPRGLVRDHGYNFLTFPREVSDIREVKVDFRSSSAMNNFAAAMKGLPFVYSIAKILRQNSLILRTYLPNSEFANMFSFFSALATEGLISDYSSVRLHFQGLRGQTISPELFTNETGWQYDLEGHVKQLRRLLTASTRAIAR